MRLFCIFCCCFLCFGFIKSVLALEVDEVFALDRNYGSKIDVYDPIESINRKVFGFNAALDRALLAPLSDLYGGQGDSWIAMVLKNFYSNLNEISNASGFFADGEFQMCVNALFRFYINSLVGFFGCLDIATAVGLPKNVVNLEVVLAKYGMPQGPYFMLPFFGPSSIRSFIASTIKHFLNPIFYLVDNTVIRILIKSVELLIDRLDYTGLEVESAIDMDAYAKWRSAYYQNMGFITSD